MRRCQCGSDNDCGYGQSMVLCFCLSPGVRIKHAYCSCALIFSSQGIASLHGACRFVCVCVCAERM